MKRLTGPWLLCAALLAGHARAAAATPTKPAPKTTPKAVPPAAAKPAKTTPAVPKPPVKPVPPKPPEKELTTTAPPPESVILLKHFGAVAQGKSLEMVDALYDFETMARRFAGEEWERLTPAGQRYTAQLLSVFFKSNLSINGLQPLIKNIRFKKIIPGALEGYTLLRYEQTVEGPYKGVIPDEEGGLLIAGTGNSMRIVDTEKEGKLITKFLRDTLATARKERGESLSLVAFLQDLVMNHGGNLRAMEAQMAEINKQASPATPTPPGTPKAP